MIRLDLATLRERAAKAETAHKRFFKQLSKADLKRLDDRVHLLHEEVFDEVDCLACANCCRSLGPRITDRDMDKMAMALRIKPKEVLERYLRVDEDGDYVFKSMPCPFLMSDNYCSIYEQRPKACREYPHTDRRKFHQIASLTVRNAKTCPAVFEIMERLTKTKF